MRGLIGWFARNGVAANMLMVAIGVLGLFAMFTVVLEVFPEVSTETVSVTVPYLGAAPEEVEEAVCVRIEEAIQDIAGIKKIRSTAAEGLGTVLAELESGEDPSKLLDQIKSRIDAIETFPDETEKPIIQESTIRRRVLAVALYGETDERTLKSLAERVRDELTALPAITQVELSAVRPYEISIELSESSLRRYGMTFDEVVRAVRSSSLDLPGGAVRADSGEILLRTKGQAYDRTAYEGLVLRALADGSRLTLGDVATVVDGFAETDETARFDGQPTALVQVFRVGDQSAMDVSTTAKEYVETLRPQLPEGISVTTWGDETLILQDRLRVLIENGRLGLLLVFLVLALFLRLRLATWVAVGIAVSFLGAVAIMPTFSVSINIMSLFAFLLALGIVVDDAIVVGENIYRHFEMGKSGLRAAIDGAREVAVPVTLSILTTLAAFTPLLTVPGAPGQFLKAIPIIVIACLVFSLIESLLVLPNHLSHLSHRREDGKKKRLWTRLQDRFAGGMAAFIQRVYRPLLRRALAARYAALAIALSVLFLTGGMIAAGYIKFEFFPSAEADNATVFLALPQGTAAETTSAAIEQIEAAAFELQRQLEAEGHEGAFRHILASIGGQPTADLMRQQGPTMGASAATVASPHLGEVNIEMAPAQFRTVEGQEVLERWRALVGTIPDAVQLDFSSSLISFGEPVDVQLISRDLDELRSAAAELKDSLRDYPGVFDISDSFRAGKREIKLDIEPRAEALGLTLADLARQVRQGFYGAEAQRIQRGRDDVRVMVRYTAQERSSLASLEDMRIRTPSGGEVPFSFAGTATLGRGFATIQRTDRQRTMNITADLDPSVATANEVLADVEATVLPGIVARHPGVTYSLVGEQEEQRQTFAGLGRALGVALLAIYGLLALAFRSYLQPMIVMSAIPFGLIGASLGHGLLGMSLTMLSLFGLIALTGVVVNDSLVMVDFINRRFRGGAAVLEALEEAGCARFRPIVLTSLTTFVGLTPLLLEKSIQAQFLIPMAISLAFGVLFATVITLLLVPVLYMILHDLIGSRATRSQEAPASDELPLPI